jgi:excisionase family DNA binding protein
MTPQAGIATHAAEYLTPGQAAQRLQVSRATVLKWLGSGTLRGAKLGYRTWRITAAEIEAFLQRQQPKKARG